jgi:hypothetical protein
MVKIIDNDKYLDPPNTIEILNKLLNTPTLGGVKSLVDETFPTWFVTIMESYCSDYPHLLKNWKQLCELSGVNRAQIIIVDDISFDDSHTLIKAFAECFTRSGFVVRRKNEYIPCEKCGCAVPSEAMWGIFKEKGLQVPEKWNFYCTKC